MTATNEISNENTVKINGLTLEDKQGIILEKKSEIKNKFGTDFLPEWYQI